MIFSATSDSVCFRKRYRVNVEMWHVQEVSIVGSAREVFSKQGVLVFRGSLQSTFTRTNVRCLEQSEITEEAHSNFEAAFGIQVRRIQAFQIRLAQDEVRSLF